IFIAVVAVLTLFIFYFIFKKLIKLALCFVLILLGIGGVLYLKDPAKMSDSIKQSVRQTRQTIQKGKDAYRDGKALYEKGKKLHKEFGEAITKAKEKKSGE
ncbi:MAG: hypothetical protein JW950_09050, partial [Deltaproteobacteria bacterium]|nr:hypothetical protein [Deltaproteobacteria bacterium]